MLVVIKAGKAEKLTEHLNTVNETENIKRTHMEEENGLIPFLDTLIERREDGSVNVKVQRKKTQTSHYMAFISHQTCTRRWEWIEHCGIHTLCEKVVMKETEQKKRIPSKVL